MRLFSREGSDFEKVWLQCFILQKQRGCFLERVLILKKFGSNALSFKNKDGHDIYKS
jgi:hypothetical protein